MTKVLKQLLLDLIKLAPDDDDGNYSSDEINELKTRAEQLLVGGDELPLGSVAPLRK